MLARPLQVAERQHQPPHGDAGARGPTHGKVQREIGRHRQRNDPGDDAEADRGEPRRAAIDHCAEIEPFAQCLRVDHHAAP